MDRSTRFQVMYFALAALGIIYIHDYWVDKRAVAHIPYSEFQTQLDAGNVKDVAISDQLMEGTLKKPVDGKAQFVTTRVPPDVAQQLTGKGVAYSGKVNSAILPTLLSWIVPVLLFFAVWAFVLRRMAARMGQGGPGGGLLSIGKSKAKVFVETDVKVRFGDVAGVDEAKDELKEVVSFLKDPKSYGRLGARMPKGVLLVGPPGTGKTLLARAVAGEASVPFFSISGSEFVEMFVGVGAARVRDLFEQARQRAPSIIFIDELDALGRARNSYGAFGGGHDEKEQTLNQLLVEMDGFDATAGIVLLAATNRPEILDPALLRAGRFDRQVVVDRPDRVGRKQILEVHARRIKLAPGVALETVAALTPGFTGADLANLVNEAALAATRRNATDVSLADFESAIERMVAGLEKKNRLLSPKERQIVAHHEMGHALVAAALPGTDPVQKISIIPRGIGALGYTIQRPTEDRYLMTKTELENKMAVLLGGRVAELLVFNHLSTGAADDLSKVTEIARSMVTRYAMVTEMGNVTYDPDPPSFMGAPPGPFGPRREISDDTTRRIDGAVQTIVQACFERAHRLLERNRALLAEGAALLLAKESLNTAELEPLFNRIERPAETEPSGGFVPPTNGSDGKRPNV